MKRLRKLQFVAIQVLSTALPAFATNRTIATCTNGEEIQITLHQTAINKYEVSVVDQSTGDSFPATYFADLKRSSPLNQPSIVYAGQGFRLSIPENETEYSDLDVPSLGIIHEILSCH